jgi:hypothetical protein
MNSLFTLRFDSKRSIDRKSTTGLSQKANAAMTEYFTTLESNDFKDEMRGEFFVGNDNTVIADMECNTSVLNTECNIGF